MTFNFLMFVKRCVGLAAMVLVVAVGIGGCGGSSSAPEGQPNNRQAQEARMGAIQSRAQALERSINRLEVEAMEAKFNGDRTFQRNLERLMAVELRQIRRLVGEGEEIVAEAKAKQQR